MRSFDESRLFYQPIIAVLGVFALALMAYVFWLTLHDISLMKSGEAPFVWFQNYQRLFGDWRAISALGRTMLFTVTATLVEVALGLAVALFLDRTFVAKRLVRALLLVPIIMTPVVVGLTWRFLFNAQAGMINYWLSVLGMDQPIDWLGDPHMAIWAVMIADVWQWTPFVILLTVASLESLSTEPMDAARVDGAKEWQVIYHVLLPMLKRSLFVVALIRAIDCVKVFDLFYIMTKGGPALTTETLNIYGYMAAFTNFDISYAMTLALALTIFTNIAFIFVYGVLFPRHKGSAV
jgi:multiple sugar transport system permease protein